MGSLSISDSIVGSNIRVGDGISFGGRHTSVAVVHSGSGQQCNIFAGGQPIFTTPSEKDFHKYSRLKITIEQATDDDEEKILTQTQLVDGVHELKIELMGDASRVQTQSGAILIKGNVTRDVSSSSGRIQIAGAVKGDVHSSSGKIEIGGDVRGDASSLTGHVHVGQKRKVESRPNPPLLVSHRLLEKPKLCPSPPRRPLKKLKRGPVKPHPVSSFALLDAVNAARYDQQPSSETLLVSKPDPLHPNAPRVAMTPHALLDGVLGAMRAMRESPLGSKSEQRASYADFKELVDVIRDDPASGPLIPQLFK